MQKIAALTPNIGVAYSGMGPDSRVLVRKARKQAQAYYRLYKEQIPVAQLCRELATVMQEFTREPTSALLSAALASWPAPSMWVCWALLALHYTTIMPLYRQQATIAHELALPARMGVMPPAAGEQYDFVQGLCSWVCSQSGASHPSTCCPAAFCTKT